MSFLKNMSNKEKAKAVAESLGKKPHCGCSTSSNIARKAFKVQPLPDGALPKYYVPFEIAPKGTLRVYDKRPYQTN